MPDQTIYQRLEAAIREFEDLSSAFKQTVAAATTTASGHADTCTNMARSAESSAVLSGQQAGLSQAEAQKAGSFKSQAYTYSIKAEQSAMSAAESAAQASAIQVGSVPYPDVWLPFNDDLELTSGFGASDSTTITVSGAQVAVPLKSRSATFTRPVASQYVNKSGATVTAAINEPCFMLSGLRIAAGEEVSIEQTNNNCVEFYNGKSPLPVEKRNGRIYFKPASGYLRNVRGFMRALTEQEKKFL